MEKRANPNAVKVAVVGSRDYPDLDAVRRFVWEQDRTTVIVSGGASGVDRAAVDEAKRLGMAYEVHLPDWNKHGKSAGAIRNRQIVESASEVAAFWDGVSRGTAITMELAKRFGKTLRVHQPGLAVVIR
jgi:pimeloyl-ACP methyl ester carboxylesterase